MTTRQQSKQSLRHAGPIAGKTFPAGDAAITFLSFDVRAPEFRAQLLEALSECDRMVGLDNVARQTFFLAQAVDRSEVVSIAEQVFGRPAPATSYVYQAPAEGQALSCEMWAFPSGATIQRGKYMTSASTPTATWGFVGGMEIGDAEPPREGLSRILGEAQRELHDRGLAVAQMVRTWYYIGGILGAGEGESPYDRFNAARNDCYRANWSDLCLSPASTGIGMGTGRIAFEGLFLKNGAGGGEISWIDNPLQTPPHFYRGIADPERKPSFSRAAAVRLGNGAVLFISGTASIRDSEVISVGDPAAQTRITIENIETLMGADNLVGNHGLARGATLGDLQGYRVYLKRAGDLDVVRDCCRRRLPPVPHTYLVADVCRPDLLVEIEGVAAFTD